jgi:hypothetical protein
MMRSGRWRVIRVLLASLVVSAGAFLASHWYRASESVVAAAERLSAWQDRTLATPHFLILYPPGERPVAALTGSLAERDYRIETANLNVHPPGRLTIIIYPDEAALDQSAGLPRTADDIGLYDAGTIRIANPVSWVSGSDWPAVFRAEGPVAHELGHALLDWVADGNYPAWFNEGVAQEEDYRATGYLWLTPTNSLSGRLYTMRQLDADFYGLANQSLAYREGLSLVQYLIARRGQPAFDRFVAQLGQSGTVDGDLQAAYGVTEAGLYRDWVSWLRAHPADSAPASHTS